MVFYITHWHIHANSYFFHRHSNISETLHNHHQVFSHFDYCYFLHAAQTIGLSSVRFAPVTSPYRVTEAKPWNSGCLISNWFICDCFNYFFIWCRKVKVHFFIQLLSLPFLQNPRFQQQQLNANCYSHKLIFHISLSLYNSPPIYEVPVVLSPASSFYLYAHPT